MIIIILFPYSKGYVFSSSQQVSAVVTLLPNFAATHSQKAKLVCHPRYKCRTTSPP